MLCCSAAVTEGFSWGRGRARGGGAPAAGRSVPGCGCSPGGRSGSVGPHEERGRGSSDTLRGKELAVRTKQAAILYFSAGKYADSIF